MSKSDIFDNYAKIMLAQNLIKQAEDPKKTLEKNPRASSSSIKDIEKLYDLKPDAPKEMQYEKNIAEVAHPTPAIFFRSHDKVNSLIENINERQTILINILKKVPTGQLTNKKYAQDLSLALIRIANDMDNKDNQELMVLADICANQLSQLNLTKTAFVPYVIGAVAVAGGLIYLANHTDFTQKGLEIDGQNLISQLEDIINSGTDTWSLKSEYKDDLKEQLKHVQEEVKKVLSAYSKISTVINELEKPRTGSEIEHLVQTSELVSERTNLTALYQQFKTITSNINIMLDKVESNFKSESFKNKEVKEEGLGSKVNDFFGGVFYGGKGLVSDEFDDVVRAIHPFKKSMQEVQGLLSNAEKAEHDAVAKVQKTEEDLHSEKDKGANISYMEDLDKQMPELEELLKNFNKKENI